MSEQSNGPDLALKDLGLIVLMNCAWGSNFVISKFAVTELPPVFCAAMRFTIVAILLFPWLKPLFGRMKAVVTLALLSGFVHFALLFIALEMTEKVSGLAIMAQLGVPIAVVMAVVLLKERIGIWRISGISLAFLGAVVLGFDPEIFEDLDAVSVMLMSVVIMAYCAILMRNMRGISPLELQAWTGLVSFLPLFGVSALLEYDRYPQILDASAFAWSAIAYSAIISSILAQALNFYLIQKYPISTVAPFSLLAPVIGVVSAVIVFGDTITKELIIGGLITLIGVLIITLRSGVTKKQKEAVSG